MGTWTENNQWPTPLSFHAQEMSAEYAEEFAATCLRSEFISKLHLNPNVTAKKPSFTIVDETKSTLPNNVSQLPFLLVQLRLQQHLAWWKPLWQLVSFGGSPFLAAWSMQKVSILNIYI